MSRYCSALSLTFILSRINPDPVCHTRNFLKSLFGLCELRHCGHNTQKIISPADQNLSVLTANDKITWWLRPQPPSKKSEFDFLRNDIRITGMIWKSYHSMKIRVKKRAEALLQTIYNKFYYVSYFLIYFHIYLPQHSNNKQKYYST